MNVSQDGIDSLIARRRVGIPPYKIKLHSDSFWYIGRGVNLQNLTKGRDCPFVVTNTNIVQRVFGRPLFALEGAAHKRRRALWHKSLNNSALFRLSKTIIDESRAHAVSWKMRFYPKESISRLTTDVCASAILGIRSRFGKAIFSTLYSAIHDALKVADKERTCWQHCTLYSGIVAAHILRVVMVVLALKYRLKGRVGESNLLAVLEEMDHSETRRGINDDLLAILVAARDTTASALIWMMWELARRPSVQCILQTESSELFVTQGGVSMRNIKECGRCQSFIFEVLRLHSPNLFAKKAATVRTTVGGVSLGKGEIVAYSPLLEHFDETLFTDAMTFMDERFVERGSWGSLLAFGSGAHACIGNRLAQLIMTIVLVQTVGRYELSQPSDGWQFYTYSFSGKLPNSDVSICLTPR